MDSVCGVVVRLYGGRVFDNARKREENEQEVRNKIPRRRGLGYVDHKSLLRKRLASCGVSCLEFQGY